MKLLLTNDDGFNSDGLQQLALALNRDHKVWLFAPDQNRSGCSHSLTIGRPIKLTRHGEHQFSCGGTPVDSVILALHQLEKMGEKIDMVVSGINNGYNIGDDLTYSGTAAAARYASKRGLVSVALSRAEETHENNDYNPLITFFCNNIDVFYRNWRPGFYYNINAPETKFTKVENCSLDKIEYNDIITSLTVDEETSYYLFQGKGIINKLSGSDGKAVSRGMLSLSLIKNDNTIFSESHAADEFSVEFPIEQFKF